MSDPGRGFSQRLSSLQYLRAVAALLVVAHHARNPKAGLYNPLSGLQIGQAGVDIFFVISGFIIVHIGSSEPATTFVRRRLARVAPLYWIVTILTLALQTIHRSPADPARLIDHVVKSLLFIPHYSLEYPSEIWPYVLVGWTLSYELLFYLIFASGLALGRPLSVSVATLSALVIAGALMPSRDAIWRTLTDPLLIEFLLGIALAVWARRGLPRWTPMLLPIGVVLLIACVFVTGPRVLVWGTPALLIVAGALGCEQRRTIPRIPLLLLLGDASYAIYLFQFLALMGMNVVAAVSPDIWAIQFGERMVGSLIAAALLGVAVHLAIEKPLLRRLR